MSPPRPAREMIREEMDSRLEALRRLASRLEGAPAEAQGAGGAPEGKKRMLFKFLLRLGSPVGAPPAASVEASEVVAGRRPPQEALSRSLTATCIFSPSSPSSSVSHLDPPTAGLEDWQGPSPTPEKESVLENRYTLQKILAYGGMSRIFLGIDLRRKLEVAIKVVPPPASALVRRSLEVTRRLSHPNIVRIEHSWSSADQGLFLVMPLLAGTTLRDLLPVSPVAAEVLLHALRGACRGLAHAHAMGVVHRDLKPANIQVEPKGRAVVLDWGLACPEGQDARAEGIVGTPLYMAPEQFEGRPATARADVYSLGVMLYQALAGVDPLGAGGDLQDHIFRVRSAVPPPPSAFRKGLRSGLDDIVLRCLSKDPEKRFRDAGELLEELEGTPWEAGQAAV